MVDENRAADCIFCKILEGQIPAQLLSEGERYIAIRDINPQAPTHFLVIPKRHIADISVHNNAEELGELFQVAAKIARTEGLSGFRVVVNTGAEAGQTVFHLHVHVLGGRIMLWPPG